MKKNVFLLFNPKAGDGDHEEENIIKEIVKAGYSCQAASTKDKGWKKIPSNTDYVAVAGGDGTVSKVIERVQHRSGDEPNWPVGILPFGTANNIAGSLGCIGSIPELIATWGRNSTNFNTASACYRKEEYPFCEATGFGLFAKHLVDMEKFKGKLSDPEEKLRVAQEGFLKSLENANPINIEIVLDGYVRTGEYLAVEVLNTGLIGPSLSFAPNVDHGDGLFDIALYTESDRNMLREYFQSKLDGGTYTLYPEVLRSGSIVVKTNADYFHVEDEVIEHEKSKEIRISVDPDPVQIFVP